MKCASKKQQLESDLRRYVQSATTNFSAVDFRKRLADWPVYALAAGSALALPNAAVADVIHSPGLPLTAASNLFLGSNFVTTGLKLTNRTGKDLLASLDVSLRLGFRSVPPLTSVFSSATARVKGNRLQFLGEGGSANLLASGAKVSSGAPGTFQSGNNLLRLKTFNKTFTSPSHLQQSGNATAGNWPSNGAGFVGFRFSTNGQVDYGYADIAVASEGGFRIPYPCSARPTMIRRGHHDCGGLSREHQYRDGSRAEQLGVSSSGHWLHWRAGVAAPQGSGD